LSFKSTITHDPYKALATWNHSFHFCDWSGISIGKRHKRVTALRLESQGLEGSLSPHVGNLSFLRKLSLPNNSFQGTIPHEVGRLSRLHILYLSQNKFSGVIPTNLSRCSNLEDLWLNQNMLTGSIPKEMSLLSKLSRLVISKNNLTGGIPPFLGNITSMKVFVVGDNPLGRSILDTLGLWRSLTIFSSYECNLYGNIPRSIFNLSLLVNFSVAVNHLTGSLPSEIGNQLPNLEFFQLWGNKLTGVLPPSISNCSKLVILEMRDNNFSGKLTIDFSELREIKYIFLQNNNLHRRGEADDVKIIDSLKNCTKLVTLVLCNCSLIGVLPMSIGNLSDQLSFLNLGDNQLSGSLPSSIGFIPDAIGNLSLLIELYLFSNKLEGHIPSSLGNCKELNGSFIQHPVSPVIPSEIKDLKMLSYLDLSHNNLSGTITSSLGECISLTELYLSGNILQGIIPSSIRSLRGLEGEVPVVGVFANASAFSVLGNNKLCGGMVILELPKCKEKHSKKKRFPFFILFIVIAPTLLIVLCCVYLFCKKKRNSLPSQSSGNERLLKVSYNELLKATNGFSTENLIGEGGFSSVYKGILDSDDDRFVAIKVLHLQNRGALKSNDFNAMVYEFMSNGCVHDWLRSSTHTSKLNLLQKINILRDDATALDYLHNHCQTTIVHDLNQNSSTRVKGTIGYAPPEYGLGSEMTSIGDVYSFGILLLEVMTGKNQTDDMFNEGLSLHKFAYMALPDHVIDVIDNDAIVLQTEVNAKKVDECMAATIKIGVSCSVDSPPQRMKIEIVVNELQRILDVLQNI
ncbi:leucine-rich repeat protein, partial [Tanacetum coccineum]